jgi:trimeric autotransporter adhesin
MKQPALKSVAKIMIPFSERPTLIVSAYGAGGALMSKTTTTTSADGRTRTVASDTNGDGVVDQSKTTTTVHNADGSSTQTVTDYNADGSVKDRP